MNRLHNELNSLSNGDAASAFERLFDLAVVLGEFMDRGLNERGLTRARATVIWRLYHDGPVTQSVLSQALRVTPRNVTSLIDALEADGFVRRDPHPTDRRATLVTLTEKGSNAAAALHAEYQEGAKYLFGGIPDTDLAVFIATLDQVLGRLRGTTSGTPDGPC